MENAARTLKRRILQSIIMLSSVFAISATIFAFETFGQEKEHASQVHSAKAVGSPVSESRAMWGFMAAAIAFGLGAIGAGIAISNVGAAAMGAVAEKPEIAGQALIFVALAEGLVVFGFIMGLLILGKI